MSKGGKKQTGAGAQGKGAGAEVNSEIPKDKAGENMVLSRRTQHSDQRGTDSKRIQSEQLQNHASNRFDDDDA